jgi:hypothetical protein
MSRQVMGPEGCESTAETLQFPKLNGSNYYTWSSSMKAALQSKYLWGIVSGRETCSPKPSLSSSYSEPPASKAKSSKTETTGIINPNSTEYKNWETNMEKHNRWLRANDAAQGLILGAMEFAQQQHIDHFSTSGEMWNHLRHLYVTQRRSTNIHYYFQELYSMKWDGYSSMSDHIGNVLSICRKITDSGQVIDETLIVHTLLSSLPSSASWNVVKQNLLSCGTNLDLDIITTELLAAYNRITHNSNKKTRQLALYSNDPGNQNKNWNKGNGQKNFNKPKKCGAKPDDICHNCGGKGHWRPDCCKPKKPKPVGTANLILGKVKKHDNEKPIDVGKVFMAVSEPKGMPSGLILDSAATCHMMSQQNLFANYNPIEGQFIDIGGCHQVPVAGIVSVVFQAILSNGTRDVCLNDVLHIPHLGANLVSLGLLQRVGASFGSNNLGLCLTYKDEEFLNANLVGDEGTLYCIQCQTFNPVLGHHIALVASAKSMRLWHRRLGHINPDQIREMVSQNLVRGLDIQIP